MMMDETTPVDDTVDDVATDTDAISAAVDESFADGADAPDTPDDAPDSVPSPDEGPEAVAEPDPIEPFAFNAFKQRNELPGLAWNPKTKTLTVQDDRGLERMKQLLSHGREWEARGRQELVALRKESQQLREQPHAEIEQAKVYMQEFEAMMQMEPEQLWQFISEARTNYPLMQAKAERAYAERLMDQARSANAPPEPDVELVVEQAQSGAAELVQEILHNQTWATPQLSAKVSHYLSDPRVLDQWVLRATRDLPEQGLRKGQYVANWDKARELVAEYTEPYRDAHGQRTQAARQLQTTQTVAKSNAAALSRAKPATPAPSRPRSPENGQFVKPDIVGDSMKAWAEMTR
jgi:NACalpha-BTF3-like transcription factor